MTTINIKRLNALAIIVSATLMAACSESDLVEIHEKELDDAIASVNAPEALPASPVDALTPADIDLSLYDLVFSDEFNDTTIDASKWSTSLWGPDTIIYNQLQYYVDVQDDDQTLDSPFSFDGQHLTISTRSTPEEQRATANEQPYLSGILSTRGKFDMTYGYIEARLDVEEGRGIWPSLWMLGSELDGLQPEVYLFEHDGAKPDSVFYNYNYVGTDDLLRSPGQKEIDYTGFSEGFRTIALKWTPDELLFYIDGQASYRMIGDKLPAEDMYLILNLAMGGVWPGAPDATTPNPATLKVDYIRVYQLKDQ